MQEQEQDKKAAQSMTIPQAIEEAERIRRMPAEYMVTPAKMKLINATLLSALEASSCYFRAAKKGEEVFVLRQQDRAAPHAIDTWAVVARDRGCPEQKVQSAFSKAIRWREQDDATTKWPD
jgi:hypothetical protein